MDPEKVTDEQAAAMALAAHHAACDAAEKMGYPRIFGLIGLERAWNGAKRAMVLCDILGPKLVGELSEQLMKSEIGTAIAEAEKILKEGE